MEITEVRVFRVREEKLKAFVSIVIDDCFMVNDIRVIQGQDSRFIRLQPAPVDKRSTLDHICKVFWTSFLEVASFAELQNQHFRWFDHAHSSFPHPGRSGMSCSRSSIHVAPVVSGKAEQFCKHLVEGPTVCDRISVDFYHRHIGLLAWIMPLIHKVMVVPDGSHCTTLHKPIRYRFLLRYVRD